MTTLTFRQLPLFARLTSFATVFMAWIMVEEWVIDRHGLDAYLPLYRVGNLCVCVCTTWWWRWGWRRRGWRSPGRFRPIQGPWWRNERRAAPARTAGTGGAAAAAGGARGGGAGPGGVALRRRDGGAVLRRRDPEFPGRDLVGLGRRRRRDPPPWLWIAAVVPSLVATAALFLLVFGWNDAALLLLAAGLLAVLAVDRALWRGGLMPAWLWQLRVRLSVWLAIVTGCVALVS